jgi:hypothetical protein
VVTFYEMTGTSASDGTPTTPLLVNAGGYVEISASALPWPKKGPWPTQGNNRFVANIVVTGIAGTGTNWNPISLVLNVVDGELSGNLNFGELSGGTWIVLSSPSFQAGQSYPMAIKWSTSNTPSLWPPSQDDYPIYFGVGDAILVPGQLYISPPGLMTWWTGPAGTGPSDAGHTLEAYSTVIVDPSAPSVQDQPLNVLQSFYNNSLVFQSGSIGYSITA